MIENILDRRSNNYSVTNLTAFIEPAAVDNSVAGATQFDPDDPAITTWFEERQKVSLKEAIAWANGFEFAVTLVLLDYEDPQAIAEAMLGGGVLTAGFQILAFEPRCFWSGPEAPRLHAGADGVSSRSCC